jgi:hypothetical protein
MVMKKKKGYAKGGAMKKKGMARGGMKKKGYAAGGALKAAPKGNKGVSKLPSAVRNKMGYMKKGGVVKGKAMTLAEIRSAAKAKGYKLVKI